MTRGAISNTASASASCMNFSDRKKQNVAPNRKTERSACSQMNSVRIRVASRGANSTKAQKVCET